jgi:hypothetical protein
MCNEFDGAQCSTFVLSMLSSLVLCVNLKHSLCVVRVGQNHICTVYIRYFWQGNHQIYGHIRCIYTVLANPMCRVNRVGRTLYARRI